LRSRFKAVAAKIGFFFATPVHRQLEEDRIKK
jgi:hypothetical protein